MAGWRANTAPPGAGREGPATREEVAEYCGIRHPGAVKEWRVPVDEYRETGIVQGRVASVPDRLERRAAVLRSEYTVAVITTTAHEAAVELTANSFSESRLDRYPSYVNPWSLHVFQHDDVDRRVGQLREQMVEAVADGIRRFGRPGEATASPMTRRLTASTE